jgi:GH35 family endo-1,4-beta-xylanase
MGNLNDFITALGRRYKDVIGFWDVLFRSNAEGDFFLNDG